MPEETHEPRRFCPVCGQATGGPPDTVPAANPADPGQPCPSCGCLSVPAEPISTPVDGSPLPAPETSDLSDTPRWTESSQLPEATEPATGAAVPRFLPAWIFSLIGTVMAAVICEGVLHSSNGVIASVALGTVLTAWLVVRGKAVELARTDDRDTFDKLLFDGLNFLLVLFGLPFLLLGVVYVACSVCH